MGYLVAEGPDNAEAASCEELFMVHAMADIAEIDRGLEIIARGQ
jgi:hypothetical protein